jgi:hypothetical protein
MKPGSFMMKIASSRQISVNKPSTRLITPHITVEIDYNGHTRLQKEIFYYVLVQQ